MAAALPILVIGVVIAFVPAVILLMLVFDMFDS